MRFKIMGLCFIAAMALSAVVSASASATNNPKWVLCEERTAGTGQWEDPACTKPGGTKTHETRLLLAGETRLITAVAKGVQRLVSTAAGITIECQKLKLASGAVLRGGEPAGDQETIVYEECTVAGAKNCKVKNKGGTFGKIETKPLISTIGFASKEAEEKENQASTVTVFAPSSGKVFVELEMETECPVKALEKTGLPIGGEVACENVGNEHAAEHELNCPEKRIAAYWLQSAGSPKEEKVKKLELAGFEANYFGASVISLGGSQLGQHFWLD